MYQHRAAAADREGANEHAGPYFDCASQKLIATSALYADGHAAYVSPYVALPGAAVQKHGQVIGTAAYDADQAVLSPNNSGYGQNIAVTSPRSINGKRAIRVSLITSRSLYNIHEPETQTSALGLNLDGAENFAPQYASTWDYDPYLARSTESPSSAVPSLTHSSRTSSAGYSTGCSTPVARRVEVPAEQEVAAKKEKRVGKAFLGKLKSFLLAPKSPASAEREIKQATKTRQRLRRSRRAPPPAIEERSTSLYRTVDIPDPLDFAPASGNRRASVFCSGPYGDLGAYNAESTASVAFGLPQSAYASVADFRHYSTAELPFDPTVPYSPYTEARESARFSALITSPVETDCSGDLQLGTDKIKLKEKDWARRSKQFWSSALDLTLPRSNRFSTMSTAELAIPPVDRPTQGLVPAPPIPARSRLRGVPSNGNIKREAASTPRTPAAYLPASPSNSSIGSSASSGQKVHSPGVPVTPDTPGQQRAPAGQLSPHEVKADYGFGDYLANGAAAGPSGWPGKLEHSPISPMAPPANGQAKRSRFSRGSRHSSSGSVSLSASSDPLRVKDGVAPRGSSSGIYTPPTFPGPSPRPSVHGSTSSVFMPMNPAMRSASGSSEMSYSTTSSTSIPQTPTSPSAAASRMYTACVGALSGWSISGSRSKRASDPQRDAAPMSASGAYFPGQSSMNSRNSSFSQSSKHQTSRSVSYASAQEAQGPVQVWSPHGGWTGAAYQAGLGVGVEEEGNYAHGRTRSSTSATTGAAMILADAPKGRRKPVPRAEGAEEEVHAL